MGCACHLVCPEFARARNSHVVIPTMSTGCPLRPYDNSENPAVAVSLVRDTALSKLEWLVPPASPSSHNNSDVFAFQRH